MPTFHELSNIQLALQRGTNGLYTEMKRLHRLRTELDWDGGYGQ